MEYVEVTYRLAHDAPDPARLAASVLLEQTVETPRVVALRDDFVRTHMMGHIKEQVQTEDGDYLVRMALPTETARVDPAQLLNVLFGNSSLHAQVQLEDFDLPSSVRAGFDGPAFGIAGMRKQIGVPDRPLTCAALKPVGLSLEKVVSLCRTFAEGGVDLIKDDHYLADHPFCPFEDRLRACQEAMAEVEGQTGHRAWYVPNLSGTPDVVLRQAEQAQEAGVSAVMVAPMLLGLPFFYALTHNYLSVPVLAHPSFAGSTRIRTETLFGKLLRLYGADAVIFANYGGRFSYPRAVCEGIARTARQPWHDFAPAFPVPAGGMQVERTPELVDCFGKDTILLIGGSLLEAGDHLLERTRAFTQSVRDATARLS